MKKTRIFASLLLIISLLLTPFTPVSAVDEAQTDTTEVTRVCEVEALRETNSETYLMSDGTYECVIFSEDKYYRDSNDALQLIDNSIVAVSEGAGLMAVTQYQNAANTFDITLTGSGTPEVSITYLDAGITFSPLGAAREGTMHMTASDTVIAIGAVNNCAALDQLTATGSNTATYANAFPATDLVYVVDNDALKEYIILKDASAPNQFSFLFELDGLTMQTVDGFTHFVNENEEIVFTLGSLFAVDANGKPTDALTYDFVPVKGNDDQMIVTVTLDNDYLTAADRAFPVVIDPTVTVTVSSSQTADTCVCSYFPSTNYYLGTNLRTGYDSDYGIRRSYLRFEIPDSITAGSIIDATLDLEKVSGVVPTVRAYRVTSSWSSSTLTWNNKPGHTTSGQSSQSVVFREGSAWYTMNVMSIVNNWVNGYSLNYGFVLIDNTENNANHWTTYYSSDAVSPHKPELIISYTDPGPTPPPPTPEPECTSISINNSTATMQVGQTYVFSADARPEGVTVTWESSNTDVATVSNAGIVTAHYPGYTTIIAKSGNKTATHEVKVAPAGGFDYAISVTNYYDTGFTIRKNNNANTIITNAVKNAASRMGAIFSLDILFQNTAYTSVTDECKISRFGAVTSANINDTTLCNHGTLHCTQTRGMRDELRNDFGDGSPTHTRVLWTGHAVASNESSNSHEGSHTIIIVPMSHSDNYQFIHELSHQLGAYDHYCFDPNSTDTKCGNPYCFRCGNVSDGAIICILNDSRNYTSATDQNLFCSTCISFISSHLHGHHR